MMPKALKSFVGGGLVVSLSLTTIGCSSDDDTVDDGAITSGTTEGTTSTVAIDDDTTADETTGTLTVEPGDQFASFDDATAELHGALADLGYEEFGGDDPGPRSESFLIGDLGGEGLQVITGWEISGPQGSFEVLPEPSGRLSGIRRGERIGVWATCGRYYLEVLDLEGTSAATEAVTGEILEVVCDQ